MLIFPLPILRRNYQRPECRVSISGKVSADAAEVYSVTMLEQFKTRWIRTLRCHGALVIDVKEETDYQGDSTMSRSSKSDGACTVRNNRPCNFDPERRRLSSRTAYVYLADKRQEMHFTQVFRAAKKTGIVPASTELLRFISDFGTMNGKDGKPFKTREGGVMRLETSDCRD